MLKHSFFICLVNEQRTLFAIPSLCDFKNHRIIEFRIERDLKRLLSPTPQLKQDPYNRSHR